MSKKNLLKEQLKFMVTNKRTKDKESDYYDNLNNPSENIPQECNCHNNLDLSNIKPGNF